MPEEFLTRKSSWPEARLRESILRWKTNKTAAGVSMKHYNFTRLPGLGLLMEVGAADTTRFHCGAAQDLPDYSAGQRCGSFLHRICLTVLSLLDSIGLPRNQVRRS